MMMGRASLGKIVHCTTYLQVSKVTAQVTLHFLAAGFFAFFAFGDLAFFGFAAFFGVLAFLGFAVFFAGDFAAFLAFGFFVVFFSPAGFLAFAFLGDFGFFAFFVVFLGLSDFAFSAILNEPEAPVPFTCFKSPLATPRFSAILRWDPWSVTL